jgi:hypothetical protein
MSQTDSYLTLCIEERCDSDYKTVVTRLFLSYDVEQETYVIYGRNFRTGVDSEPFFFRANKSVDMYKFVKFLVSKQSMCSYTLYNYNNMPFDLEYVDYFFMEENMDIRYELAAYDDMKICRKDFRELSHMLKNVYNVY